MNWKEIPTDRLIVRRRDEEAYLRRLDERIAIAQAEVEALKDERVDVYSLVHAMTKELEDRL